MMFHRPLTFVVACMTLVGVLPHRSEAAAPPVRVDIGISGWTGFAPLTLAKEAGIFARHGLDVRIHQIPQKDRHLALASRSIQCAATSIETWIVWNSNGIATKQVFKMDQGRGSDGIVARPGIQKVTDLKGKTIAVSAPGTNPHFSLAWILNKNGLGLRDVKLVTMEPALAANALMAGAGNLDAAVTYEPYLSAFTGRPGAGKLIADSSQYSMVFDSFGCTTAFLEKNVATVQALTDSYFAALDMIRRERTRSFTIMGAAVKQTAAQFETSQAKLEWADKAANQRFFAGELQAFNREAAALLKDIGVLRSQPKLDSLFDARFVAH